MTDFLIHPSSLGGSLLASPSKSHGLRAILFASLARGISQIQRTLASPDTLAMINACRQLGANIETHRDNLQITGTAGVPQSPSNVIDAGNSGQVLRFIACVAALTPHYVVITGDASIRSRRPLQPLLEALPRLGVWCRSMLDNQHAPILLKGPLQPGTTCLSGADSQPVSGLLIAASQATGEHVIEVNPLGELPWVKLTLAWFDKLGIAYQQQDHRKYSLCQKTLIQAFDYTIPCDFSSLAYPVAAAIITGSKLSLQQVDMDDVQGDKALFDIFTRMGASIHYEANLKTLHLPLRRPC